MSSRMKRKKGKKNPYFILLLIVIGGIGVCCLFLIINKNNNMLAREAADKFILILEKKQYDKLDDLLDIESYTSLDYSLEEVKDKYNRIINGINIHDIHASEIVLNKLNNKKFELSFQLSFTTALGDLKNLNYNTEIIKKDGRYLVKWNPSLIFPEMEGKDKVILRQWRAERGEIIDRFGNGLAINEEFKEVGIVPKDLSSGGEKEKRLKMISQQFDIPIEDIQQRLNQDWVKDDLFVPLKIVKTEKEEIIPGISYQNIKMRYYPLKEAAAHLTGYTGKVTKEEMDKNPHLAEGDIIGKMGLEKAFDNELRGKDGGEIFIVDENGEKKKEIQSIEKIDGKDIQLTIDTYIQKGAFNYLRGKPGATVVMNPKEGNLYALVSSPSFDPNKMVQGISQSEYDEYANDENKPFIARYANGYAPGSTFKVLTASIGLDAEVTHPDKTRKINGLSWKKDETWGGYSITRVSDVENVDMRKALIYSDNIYFAQEALEMGEKDFRKGLSKFLFEEELDLTISMKPAQISKQPKFNSEIHMADTAYGQGELLISPIQQAAMYTIFQNDGNLIYPKLLEDGEEPKTKLAISSTTANEIKRILKEVVNDPNGTAHSLYNEQFQLAAKTGTAELKMQQGEQGDENSFLLAFDTEHNDFLLLSLVEHYKVGSSATLLNKPLIEDLYEYFQIR